MGTESLEAVTPVETLTQNSAVKKRDRDHIRQDPRESREASQHTPERAGECPPRPLIEVPSTHVVRVRTISEVCLHLNTNLPDLSRKLLVTLSCKQDTNSGLLGKTTQTTTLSRHFLALKYT